MYRRAIMAQEQYRQQQRRRPLLERLVSELPVVRDAYTKAMDMYRWVKSLFFVFFIFEQVERVAAFIGSYVGPFLDTVTRPMREHFDKKLDDLLRKYPVLRQPTNEVIYKPLAENYQRIRPYVGPFLFLVTTLTLPVRLAFKVIHSAIAAVHVHLIGPVVDCVRRFPQAVDGWANAVCLCVQQTIAVTVLLSACALCCLICCLDYIINLNPRVDRFRHVRERWDRLLWQPNGFGQQVQILHVNIRRIIEREGGVAVL